MKTVVGYRKGVSKKSNKPYQWIYWTEESSYVNGLITGETYLDLSTGLVPRELVVGDRVDFYAEPGSYRIISVVIE